MNFYTSIDSKFDNLFLRGYRDGVPFKETIKYSPYLFLSSTKPSLYKTIGGKNVERIDFDKITDTYDFRKKYESIEGIDVYGQTDFKYTYLYENYPGKINYNFDLLNIISIDIETDSKDGYGDIDTADKEITAITIAKNGKTVTFGFYDYTPKSENNRYIKCKDEITLLNMFNTYWNMKSWRPDILTGYNCKFYDVRYIVNRMKRVLPEDEYLRLSPFKIIEEYKVNQKNGKSFKAYNLYGIQIIDYYELYLKFAEGERESYTLDFIAEYELGEKKTDYIKYGSLNRLYQENKELFYDYNINDTILVEKLEEKLHYIEQIVVMSYIIKCNFENVIKTVKPWDILIHNYLMDRQIVVPIVSDIEEDIEFIGGYVKEPVPGLYKNVVTLDFTSLYPSTCILLNISPDTIVGKSNKSFGLYELCSPDMEKYTKAIQDKNFSLAANGCFFRRNKQGFFPAIMQYFLDERVKVRQLEKIARKEYEEDKGNIQKRNAYLRLKNIQIAYKLLNNSGYGASGNRYFRWFNKRLAEGITSTGQLTSKYVAFYINKFLNKKFNTDKVDYVIYQDTDSAYVNLDRIDGIQNTLQFTENELQPEIDRICEEFCYKLNAYQNKLFMKLEKIADKAFFTAKKRYALNVSYDEGIFNDPPKLKVIGLEPRRSSIPKVCREAIRKVYELIFEGDQSKICKYISDFKKEFYKMSFEEIGAPTSIHGMRTYYDEKDLYKKHTPVHVKGSFFYNKLLVEKGLDKIYEPIYDFDKVKWCYLIEDNPTKQPILSIKSGYPKEFDLEKFINYDLMWNKVFYKPIEIVANIIGFKLERKGDLNEIFS